MHEASWGSLTPLHTPPKYKLPLLSGIASHNSTQYGTMVLLVLNLQGLSRA
jgi:hypothetical protein